MRASDAIIMLVGMAAILALYSWATVAYASEPCIPISAAVEAAESVGGHLIDLVDVPGQLADQVLIIQNNDTIMMLGAKGGCIVAGPFPLDSVKDMGTPA
jgi:hypothetical protein